MAQLYLASNYVLAGFGHLQLVYQADAAMPDALQEVEVQGPDNGFAGNWVYPAFGRDHLTHTPFYGDPDKYKAVELPAHDAHALWALFAQLDASFAAYGAGINYEFDQNSNSFINTMLWAVGINLADFAMTTSAITSFPGSGSNVLLGARTDAGADTAIRVVVDLTPYDDDVHTGIGNDSLGGATGSGGRDRLWLGAGDDTAKGGAGADVLRGEAGDDSLVGGAGNDVLIGGAGRDMLIGGTFAGDVDRYVFARIADTVGDVLTGFGWADVIDLRRMDADAQRTGDQAFHFSTTARANAVSGPTA